MTNEFENRIRIYGTDFRLVVGLEIFMVGKNTENLWS